MDDYRFNSETDPTDEQLYMLMHEVGEEVRESNVQMRSAFFAHINQQLRYEKTTTNSNCRS